MRWVGRILLGLVLVAIAGGAGAYFYFKAPVPDARLACYYGAYDLSAGGIAVVSPSSGTQNLRLVLMTGETWFLQPLGQSAGVPNKFSISQGWTEKIIAGSDVGFGTCAEGKLGIRLAPPIPSR